jgi:general secretion pathway protein D
LYYVLLTNQLEQQVMDQNTLLIYPNNAAKQKEYQQTVVRSFQLQNASVKSIAESLKTLLKSKDVVIDEKLNLLILRDSPEAVKLAERLIAAQDMRQPEVMLDVEVLEVSRDRLLELGVQLPSSLSLGPLTTAADGKLTLNALRSLTGDTVGATIDPLKINARKVDTDTNILANPRIRVVNTEKAKITIGNKVPSITSSTVPSGASSFVAESVTYIDVGVKLEVEPTIYANDEVAIRISLEVSNIVDKQTTPRGTTTYTIGNRAAQTILRLKDGENQVLAGLINDEDRRTANKFPGLGDLPMVGRLFGSGLSNKSKTEIVLSITPRLVRNNEITDEAEVEFASGTDNSLRAVPKRRDSKFIDLPVAPSRDRSPEPTPDRVEGSK